MNIMIPMAGRGSRFLTEGYRQPKPLINIVGRPMLFWLLDNLKFEREDTIWVGVQRELEAGYGMEALLRKEYPSLDMRVVPIDFQTRGAAETLFIVLQHMSSAEAKRKSISLDCDTIYFSDVLGSFRKCAEGHGSSFYFEDEQGKPIFSYIEFESGSNRIVRIREKEAISRYANTGAYAFPCGDQLRSACRKVLDDPVGKTGEFYTSSIIEGMIRAGQKFVGIHMPSFACVGTPAQLRSFLCSLRTGATTPRYKARVRFDLDRLLRIADSVNGVESAWSIRPVERSVRVLQAIRIMGICYDEIVFGKPVADVHIDSMTCHACVDMEKEIGWCLQSSEVESATSACFEQDFVTPRSFNRVSCVDNNLVVKSAPFEYLRGELFFYRSIPPDLTHLFPTLVEANDDSPGQTMPSMTITKARWRSFLVDGVSFSHLVTNHCVTRGRFGKLLGGLGAIHAAKKSPSGTNGKLGRSSSAEANQRISTKDVRCIDGATPAPASEPSRRRKILKEQLSQQGLPASTICANLHNKACVLQRLEKYAAAYAGIAGADVPRISHNILSHLHCYQERANFCRTDFVHGDPVFSNCLLNKESEVVFIDMRGALGDLVCTEGDMHYDLSKVYQSLCGYDFIILDKDIDPKAAEMLLDLKENVFWPFVRENYPAARPEDITMLAASHFLSIVPLHDSRRHQARFLEACEKIL
ncbi:unnamed protein product, partial [Scytosiphon promiscuus]